MLNVVVAPVRVRVPERPVLSNGDELQTRDGRWSMRKIFYIFVVLQITDLLTTVLALKLGGAEQNSMVRALMSVGPYKGLILSKLIVLSLALGFALSKKQAAIRNANVVFAAIVAWNLTVIVRLLS
jgi:hypothetical protein